MKRKEDKGERERAVGRGGGEGRERENITGKYNLGDDVATAPKDLV